MVIKKVTFSFVNILEPKEDLSGNLKYSAQIILDKTHPQIPEIQKAISNAKDYAVSRAKFTAGQANSKAFKNIFRDGNDTERPELQDKFFFNASNAKKPQAIDLNAQPLEPDEVYSGMVGSVDVQFFGYNAGGAVGIGASLVSVLKSEDGPRLDGSMDATEAFKDQLNTQLV